MDEYTDVLLGRVPPPFDRGILTLQEYANAVYSRAMEITARIQRAEASGAVLVKSAPYKFRTGELATFCEMAKRAADLGSRRVTVWQVEQEMRHWT